MPAYQVGDLFVIEISGRGTTSGTVVATAAGSSDVWLDAGRRRLWLRLSPAEVRLQQPSSSGDIPGDALVGVPIPEPAGEDWPG